MTTIKMNRTPMPAGDGLSDNQRFSLLVASVSDYAIYMLDPGGLVSSWNAGAERFKGYREDEILGRHFSVFYTAEDQAAGVPGHALDTARREGRFEAEGRRVRKDGSTFWASVVIDAIRNEAGVLLGYAKITRDITDKKQAEAQLERANAALFQAQKMEAIGQLTGGIAHDFNNLLAVVSGSLELLAMPLGRWPTAPAWCGSTTFATPSFCTPCSGRSRVARR